MKTIHILPSLLFLLTGILLIQPGRASTPSPRVQQLEQIVSQEDPRFQNTPQHISLSAGEDGRVYLTCVNGAKSLLLSMNPDGSRRKQYDLPRMGNDASANADGIIAASVHHFIRSVFTYTPDGEQIGRNGNFLGGDKYPHSWQAPNGIVAAPDGTFFASDLNRERVVHLDAHAELLDAYTIDKAYFGTEFDVDASRERIAFKNARRNRIPIVGFDGKLKHEITTHPHALFAFGPQGTLFTLWPGKQILQRFDLNGEPLPDLELQLTDNASLSLEKPDEFDIQGDRIYVRWTDDAELFRVFDRTTGKQLHVVRMNASRVSASYETSIWTAGSRIPFQVDLERPKTFASIPLFKVWAAPLGSGLWTELDWDGSSLTVPENAAGLYQIRVGNALSDAADSVFQLDGLVEIRIPDSRGTLSVWSPFNRIYFARGATVPLQFMLRSSSLTSTPARVVLEGPQNFSSVLWEGTLSVGETQKVNLASANTLHLAPGFYTVRPEAASITCIPQPLNFGVHTGPLPAFRTVMYGDYFNNNYPRVSLWGLGDYVRQKISPSTHLGFNQFINRTFANRYILQFFNADDALQLIRRTMKQQAADPDGAAPAKADFGFPQLHYVGAYGGLGMREMLLPIGMDSSVNPEGNRGANTQINVVKSASRAFRGVRGFYGWTWVANWWLPGPERVLATADLKKAQETGEWNPNLEKVGERNIQYQIESQRILKEAMDEINPDLVTASSGPYRRPEIYAPENFSNVDEIDLHYQMEQITAPLWTAHAPNYYRIPGKPGWLHPELGGENGTGEYTRSLSWLGIMRGADGVGSSGPFKGIIPPEKDSRAGYFGIHSVFRSLNQQFNTYGEWFTRLENRDRIGIPVSKREVMVDRFEDVIGGPYFARLFEAYLTLLYAGHPATFIYPETATDDVLQRLDAVLVVAQGIEPAPAFKDLLRRATEQGATLLTDAATREGFFPEAKRLAMTFDQLKQQSVYIGNEDYAFWNVPRVLREQAERVTAELAGISAPVLKKTGNPDVLVSERGTGDLRTYWIVNNTLPPLDPELLWAVSLGISSRAPAAYSVEIPLQPGETLYDVFSGEQIHSVDPLPLLKRMTGSDADSVNVTVSGTLRGGGCRVLAVLPHPVESVEVDIDGRMTPGELLSFNIKIPNVGSVLPVRFQLLGKDGSVVETRYSVSGRQEIPVPLNAKMPLTVVATELITGHSSDGQQEATPRREPLEGPRLRDVAVSPNGSTALINAFDWDRNFYRLDLSTGAIENFGKVGHYQAFAPLATRDGFLLQGYDLLSAEGYHSYQLTSDGDVTRRFALPGVPARMKPWHFPSSMIYPINQHAAPESGRWLAVSGNLGVEVYTPAGKRIGGIGWSGSERKRVQLQALNDDTLLVGDGMTLSAYPISETAESASLPEPRWSVELDGEGIINRIQVSADRGTIAVGNQANDGRIFLLDADGTVKAVIPEPYISVAVSPDGSLLAISPRNRTDIRAADGGLLFSVEGTLYSLAFSPDGKQLAGSTLSGEIVLIPVDRDTAPGSEAITRFDFGTVAQCRWLPDGDLLLTGWLGKVARYAPDGAPRWIQDFTDIQPQVMQTENGRPAPDTTPTVRNLDWVNNIATPLPLNDNLLSTNTAILGLSLSGKRVGETEREYVYAQKIGSQLTDGDTTPPASGWLTPRDVGLIDSGWMGKLWISIDFHRNRARVDAVTIVEDPDHPESWIRDARLEYFDETDGTWKMAGYLSSDAPVHSHRLKQPVIARKFRISAADQKDWPGEGWKPGNIRLAELVFHGKILGPAHPDAAAGNPVAVLFDNDKNQLPGLINASVGGRLVEGDAYSGGTYLRSEKNHQLGSANYPVFAQTFPGWDFKIAENPQPGEYRWIQYAIRAEGEGNAEDREGTLRLGPAFWETPRIALRVGNNKTLRNTRYEAEAELLDEVPTEWTVVRADLWNIITDAGIDPDTFRIRELSVWVRGGMVSFDQILLGRTEADLEAMKPSFNKSDAYD